VSSPLMWTEYERLLPDYESVPEPVSPSWEPP
jgi:hypothetical protein